MVPFSKTKLVAGVVLLTLAAPALQAQDEKQVPEVFSNVVKCRAIADDQARLACFDAAVGEMASAKDADDLLVMSREQVRETRRGLFGLKLPSLKIFGGGGENDGIEAVKRLEAKIASVGRVQGGYVFRLEDGAVWDQTDNSYLRPPKEGDSIVIERASLGSYFARVNGGVAVRVRRRN